MNEPWDEALDAFEASLSALESALEDGDWDELVLSPLRAGELGELSPSDPHDRARRARRSVLDERWRSLEPRLVQALSEVEREITQLGDTRRAVAGYASAGAAFST